MPNNILLRVNGKEFGGWKGATVEKSLYTMTGAFGLTATDIFPGNFEKWGMGMGDECSVVINDQVLITGYIEDIPISYNATDHSIQIGGRDKTGDLVDCSFTGSSKEWINQTIIKVIIDLCSPFGITVETDATAVEAVSIKTPDKSFKATEGDVVFDLILKLCKMVGILPVSYGDGKLILTATGTQTTNDILEFGKNVKSGSINQSDKERFKTYIVKGQGTQPSGFQKTVDVIGQPTGQYNDDIIRRHRPIIIFPETKCTAADCLKRAKWEAVNRAGKSRSLEYEVQGWTQSNGIVWPLNSLVKVKDAFLEINSTLLIASVNFSINNDGGTITRINLVHPDTFKVPATKEAIKKIKSGVDWKSKTEAQVAATILQ